MNKTPIVSVVILTYNHEKYIADAIESVLAQDTNYPYEIVIGEDCSTDSTLRICQSYQTRYPGIIRLIASEKNLGILGNWDRTVKATKGKYISGCGGDDYWHHKKKLEFQANILENRPEFGMVHSDVNFYYQENNQLVENYFGIQDVEKNSSNIVESLLNGDYAILASSVMFRKELYEKYYDINELKENGFMMEDTPLWVEIAIRTGVYYFQESMVTKRVLEESISRSKNVKKVYEFKISVIKMITYYCSKYQLIGNIEDTQKKNLRKYSLKLAFYEKNILLAKKTKKESDEFTMRDYVWYFGTVNKYIGVLLWIFINLRDKIFFTKR